MAAVTTDEPIDDVMVEKILQMGEYINDNTARLAGLKVLKVKCDKCFMVGIPASFRWNGLDICLLCAHKHKTRDIELNPASNPEYSPALEAESKSKLHAIMTKFIGQKVSSSDMSFVPVLVNIAFSTLRHTLPKAFWDNADQSTINTFDGFIERMRDRFVDTFGREYLAKVYNIEYETAGGDAG
jgi:hypothetical protein